MHVGQLGGSKCCAFKREKKSLESAQFVSRHSEVSGEASTEEEKKKRREREGEREEERHFILVMGFFS